ncbi:MAG: ribbon-helix-helix domain-containing protein [Gammaproteobacteria bacterium]|nr:ribbon-helix-helix domain-containing protein [Gammaproteobacteria bacterium]
MATKTKRSAKANVGKSVRTSVSLPHELHDTLVRLAKDKKVSVAWVIRDAAERYIGEQWPLFNREIA